MAGPESGTLNDDRKAVEADADAIDADAQAVADDAALLDEEAELLDDQDSVWDDAAAPLERGAAGAAAGTSPAGSASTGSRRPGAAQAGGLPADSERILAATLALMTGFYQSPQTAICRTLLDNLTLLSRHPQLSEPLRSVCRNAESRWASYLEEIEQALAELDAADAEDDSAPTLH